MHSFCLLSLPLLFAIVTLLSESEPVSADPIQPWNAQVNTMMEAHDADEHMFVRVRRYGCCDCNCGCGCMCCGGCCCACGKKRKKRSVIEELLQAGLLREATKNFSPREIE